jgi:crotonobetainyl-CoA:carnitine CoA-transferase CaiB-like acyl-CoA transferase
MEGPLTGVRVLEVANWLAAPAGCALLADFGAEVVKVEPPNGDPYRGFQPQAYGYQVSFNFAFELDNRGKRGMTLNLEQPQARDVLYRLVTEADVFVTNLLPQRRERYGLTYQELTQHRPDLIYLSLTGYGSEGPDRDRPGYDYAAFWARSGIMALLGEPDAPPPPQRPGMGDHTTALLVAGSVAMALLDRQRTGQGQEVDVSLHNTGLWVLGMDIQGTLLAGEAAPRVSRQAAPNPLFDSYRTGDGRWLMLVMLVSDMYWPQFCRAIERVDLENDPRFASFEARLQNCKELIALLDVQFAQRTLEEWGRRLDDEGCIWAPAQTTKEVIGDPQSRARGAFTKIDHPTQGEMELLDTPVKFSKARVGARGPAPELGQHTEEVLLEAGYNWDDIVKLRDEGVI